MHLKLLKIFKFTLLKLINFILYLICNFNGLFTYYYIKNDIMLYMIKIKKFVYNKKLFQKKL